MVSFKNHQQKENMTDRKAEKAIGIRMPEEEYQVMYDIAMSNRHTVTAFVQGCVESCIEQIQSPPSKPIPVPRFLAMVRLSHHWPTETTATNIEGNASKEQ